MNLRRTPQSGMTIIELLSALAISAMTLMFGVPGFQSMVASSSATSQVNDMVAGLNLARSEAIRRGRSVDFSAISGAWSGGWTVGIDANADGDYKDVGDTEIRVWTPSGTSLTPVNAGGLTTITYTARGHALAATSFTLTDCPMGANNGRSLAIAASGHASATRVACDG